ncbi:hypothetical protein POVWA2_051270 [Plasmodium ovale wallikeri]|uniref:Uncharacterized protein n=1 Tax=Plasmodium ovale wallikeri TaxID=864142 RepID=A0A1A8ZNN5_PLAOA|nr:hypothetical protein POVWA1_051900 [Plasmodium ovale wallikeri]SBT46054.1 hypothetical protein POVWA2_051270 [Plasmodium ovale wallikeri]
MVRTESINSYARYNTIKLGYPHLRMYAKADVCEKSFLQQHRSFAAKSKRGNDSPPPQPLLLGPHWDVWGHTEAHWNLLHVGQVSTFATYVPFLLHDFRHATQ